jgi:hypothetical protein
LVSDSRHSADYDYRPLFEPPAHDVHDAADGLGIANRGAAEFHDDAVSH